MSHKVSFGVVIDYPDFKTSLPGTLDKVEMELTVVTYGTATFKVEYFGRATITDNFGGVGNYVKIGESAVLTSVASGITHAPLTIDYSHCAEIGWSLVTVTGTLTATICQMTTYDNNDRAHH